MVFLEFEQVQLEMYVFRRCAIHEVFNKGFSPLELFTGVLGHMCRISLHIDLSPMRA